jgi:DNA-binding NarL/FixJ family response regulator
MTTLLLVDGHTIFREGLTQSIRSAEPTMRVATAPNAKTAADLTRVLVDLDAAVIDFYLPDNIGIPLVKSIRRTRPQTRILILSGSTDPGIANLSLRSGAHSFMHKSVDTRGFLDTLRRVLDGESGIVVASPQRTTPPTLYDSAKEEFRALTVRQWDVLKLLCEGYRNKTIAEHLRMSEKTVKAHLSAIYAALGVSNRTEATLVARRSGVFGQVV